MLAKQHLPDPTMSVDFKCFNNNAAVRSAPYMKKTNKHIFHYALVSR